MKDSRRSSSTYTESLFLHIVKHNLLFLFLFFYLAILSPKFTIHRTPGEGGGFLPLLPALQTPRHQLGYCCRELTSAHNWQRNLTWNLWYTFFRIHSIYTCTGSCCCWRMLKTRVTLGNISRALLNLTKRLIFAMSTQLTVIFFLQLINYGCFAMFTQLTVKFSLQLINYGCFSS